LSSYYDGFTVFVIDDDVLEGLVRSCDTSIQLLVSEAHVVVMEAHVSPTLTLDELVRLVEGLD